MCFGAQRGPHFIAWQGQTPGRVHKGTASSSVSARPPSHHILQSAGRAGSLSPAPCPVAEPSTFLCARGTTEDLTVPLCCPVCGHPSRAYIALTTSHHAWPTAPTAGPPWAPSSGAAAAREGAPALCQHVPSPVAALCSFPTSKHPVSGLTSPPCPPAAEGAALTMPVRKTSAL